MQIFTIFHQFINWPEYESCAFNAMLEKHLEKLYSNLDDERSRGIDSDDEGSDDEEEEEELDETPAK
jgi:hypothetical protein